MSTQRSYSLCQSSTLKRAGGGSGGLRKTRRRRLRSQREWSNAAQRNIPPALHHRTIPKVVTLKSTLNAKPIPAAHKITVLHCSIVKCALREGILSATPITPIRHRANNHTSNTNQQKR